MWTSTLSIWGLRASANKQSSHATAKRIHFRHQGRCHSRWSRHSVQHRRCRLDRGRAAKTPENDRNLLARLPGYSDCFVDLDTDHQHEVIARIRHKGFKPPALINPAAHARPPRRENRLQADRQRRAVARIQGCRLKLDPIHHTPHYGLARQKRPEPDTAGPWHQTAR